MNVLQSIRKMPLFFKKLYKEYLFRKFAKLGDNVAVYSMSNIKCDENSEIVIMGHNDLLCSILAMGGG